MVVSCYEQPSVSLAKRFQIPQRFKHIDRIADIVKQDVIEFFVSLENLPELSLIWKCNREFEVWISLLCDCDNLSADINTFAHARPNDSQKIACVAANREYLFLWFHQKTEKPTQQFIIVCVAVDPDLAPRSNP